MYNADTARTLTKRLEKICKWYPESMALHQKAEVAQIWHAFVSEANSDEDQRIRECLGRHLAKAGNITALEFLHDLKVAYAKIMGPD